MKKLDFNSDWKFVKGYVASLKMLQMYGKEAEDIRLPHDAMIHEDRTEHTANGGSTGFYPGGTYTYFKTFHVPEEWEEKTTTIEFEGVYETAMVYINGTLVKTNRYGYTNFYVNLSDYLNYGQDNELKVVVTNSEENSRWYSGSGIYRNVNLYVGDSVQIPVNGVRATVKDADAEIAVVEFSTKVANLSRKKEKLTICVEMEDDEKKQWRETVHLTAFPQSEQTVYQSITIPSPKLWSCEKPDLYDCKVTVSTEDGTVYDEEAFAYGIRKVTLDAIRGLCINGKQVKLRGTCIHHDNGILGAATFEDAEYRKCELIKKAGFNSVRSAHNPMSKEFLDACDRLGILIMDELTDMWTVHKNKNDFAFTFHEEWQDIVKAMVEKDYNHPCVILYSAGNEIQEVGTERGAEWNRRICNYFKELDGSRYTTNGINALNAAGAYVYQIMQELRPMIQKSMESAGTNDNSGSNAINSFMKLMEGEVGDAFATHPLVTKVLQEASESMDIIGLNYLTGRHLLEGELHPNKCVLPTETFPADIVRLWSVVKASAKVLGDFTWTGYDYLGEAGCGIFYYDGKHNFASNYPDRTAYIGDIDLAGYRRPISYLRETVYGLRKEPYIAVERVDKYGKPCSKTPWMFKDNVASWTWHGFEGAKTCVDIYSDAEEVELFLNGTSLGRKAAGEAHDYTASYEISYEPGVLEAVNYRNGAEAEHCVLKTAAKEVTLRVETDRTHLSANERDLCYLTIHLVDENGTDNLEAERKIHIAVEGAGTLQGFGNGDPQAMERYDSDCFATYDGYALAAVRAGKEAGELKVSVWTEGAEQDKQTIVLTVE